ncbi:MAG: CHAD domain-containing protein [Omnitrophica WOR_2 bacterium]
MSRNPFYPAPLLGPETRRQVQYVDEHAKADTVRNRARILILYDDGQNTRVIASQVGLSPSTVRRWRRQFARNGMSIFPINLDNHPEETPGELTPEGVDEGQLLEQKEVQPSEQPDVSKIEQAPVSFPRPLEKPGIEPEDSMAEAGRKTLLFHFAEMLSHEMGTRLGQDPEELHDMRVATRRMRAAMDIFGSAYPKKEMKTLLKGMRLTGHSLGSVRDLDVLIDKTGDYLDQLPESERSGLDPLLLSWGHERDTAREALISHLDSNSYQKFKIRLSTFLDTAGNIKPDRSYSDFSQRLVRDEVPVLIYTRLASIRAFASVINSATLEQLHALRIEFKKFRYAMEFFSEVLGNDAKEVIKLLKDIQDHLGNLNDARVACQLISQFLENWEEEQSTFQLSERLSLQPIVAFLAAKHAERHHLMVTFPRTWEAFTRPEVRHDLAMAISVL